MSHPTVRKLNERADQLAAEGADPLRVELLRRARRFKRSWLEMAEALSELKIRRAYEQWGFADLYGYCAEELLLKRPTVDKLTGSYHTVKRHAPELLGDADDARLPSFEAVDYFARAVGERGRARSEPPPRDVVEQLERAVFEEARPVAAIRREFHASLFPAEERDGREQAERARAQIRRLLDALATIDGLSAASLRDATRVLEGVERELVGLSRRPPKAGESTASAPDALSGEPKSRPGRRASA